MNNFKTLKPSILLLISISVCSCANFATNTFTTQHNQYEMEKDLNLDDRQRADLYEAIIAADIAEHQQDHLTAMSYYLYAAELSQNQQLIEKSIQAAKAANDPLGLEQAVNIWLKLSPNNVQAHSLLFESQLAQREINPALQTLIQLLNTQSSSEKKYQLLDNQVIKQDPQVANYLLSELIKISPQEIAYITGLGKFYFLMANENSKRDKATSSKTIKPSKLYAQAYQLAQKALDKHALFIAAVRLKTHILYQLHEDNKARSYLQNLAYHNPKSVEINRLFGQLLYDLNDYQASANHYLRWLKKYPKDLDAKNYLAASYYALKQYPLSLKLFKQLLNKNYELQSVAFYCGDSAQNLGDREQAIDCFEQVNQGRFHAIAKIQLAKIHAEKKAYNLALNILQTPYSLNENDQIKLLLAEINLLNKHFSLTQAKQRLESALQQTPNNLALILKKIELYELINKPVELNQLLSQARDLIEPGEKLDRFNLAAAALLQNNQHYQLAINWLDHAISNKVDDKDLLYTRALYKESLGLYQQMINEFEYLLSHYPDDLHIKNALGYTLADLNKNLDYAESLIDSAYQGLPNSAAVIDSKGWLAFRQGKLDAAEEYLKRAFVLSPSPEGAAHLGEVLWQKGKHEQAKLVWQKGIALSKSNRILVETLERLKIEF